MDGITQSALLVEIGALRREAMLIDSLPEEEKETKFREVEERLIALEKFVAEYKASAHKEENV